MISLFLLGIMKSPPNKNDYPSKIFRHFLPIILACFLLVSTSCSRADNRLPLHTIKLPAGFKIDLYAFGITNARSMALGPKGILFVGTRTAGNVYALIDEDNDKKVDRKIIIARKLRAPNGIAFKDGALYVSEISRVWRYDDIEAKILAGVEPKPTLIRQDYPTNAGHGWKFIRFGPDGKLYIPVGAPCNTCERDDKRYASITRMTPDGKNVEIFASGIRNSVGFDWHPETKELWFTDNGRDMLGDDMPPDELNRAPQKGMHFGFPYCHGKSISDPKFGEKFPCQDFTPPAQELGPHVAALGMRFYAGGMFPKEYHHQIFIAEHGSWNRSKRIGYRVALVRLRDNQPISYEVFAQGWLQGERAWGRPVDVLVMDDGSLLVSDDYADAIYRISYAP